SSPALTWCPLAGADHYVVYRDGVAIDTTPTTAYTDTSITVDGTYQYKVTAVSPDGLESAKSTPASVLVDTTAPILGDPSVSPNPKPGGQTAHLTATATDAGSGVTGGEYYIGDTDP